MRALLSLLMLLPALGVSAQSHEDLEDRVIQAHPRGDAEIRLDGRPDEAIWAEARPSRTMHERRPNAGTLAPLDSELRFLYDSTTLWVSTCNELSPGEVPRAAERTRDSINIFSDDTAILKFDVRRDRRNTVGFGVNPAGAQIDFVAIERGRSFRREFDAVWDAAVHVDSERWCVEWRIPVAALGLAPTEGSRILGFNFTRDHNARNATYDWSPMPVELGPASAHHYGELRGLEGMASGRPLSLIPYALAGWGNANESVWPQGSHAELLAGGDIRMRIADDTWGEVTLLTDFAQVDLDDAVINLGRFPLFLPERRPFFLSGLDVFTFGAPESNQLFFSRRIGLGESDDPVPMYGGVKLYGRAGPISFGLLDVVTDDNLTNWSVLRSRWNYGEGSYLGVLGTMRAPLEEGAPDYSVGADFLSQTFDGRLEFGGFFAATLNSVDHDGTGEAEREHGLSGVFNARWRGPNWRPSVRFAWTEEAYDPRVGFVRRRDIARPSGALTYVRRPEGSPLETLRWSASGNHRRSADLSEDLGHGAELEFEARWRNGWSTELEVERERDVVEEAFEILPDVSIASGDYTSHSVAARLSRSDQRNPSLTFSYAYTDGFYGGVAHRGYGELTFNLGALLRMTNQVNAAFFRLTDGEWRETVAYGSRLTIAPDTRFFADIGCQLNSSAEQLDLLGRLRWRYSPGSDLFFLYRGRHIFSDMNESWEHRVTLKLTFRHDVML